MPERQIFAVDESKVYTPPSKLHLPDAPATNSDSALSLQEDSDMSSSASSSPSYSHDAGDRQGGKEENIFRYDSGNTVETSKRFISNYSFDSPNLNRSANPPGSPKSPLLARAMTASSQSPKTPPPPRPAVPPSTSSRLTPPIMKKPFNLAASGLKPLGVSMSVTKKLGGKPDSEKSATSSIISTISKELTDIAHSATSTASELFVDFLTVLGSNKQLSQTPVQTRTAAPKPFTPLGNRKALVEKSGLVKHATNRKPKEPQKLSPVDTKANSNSDNQQFLKEVINGVLEGKGVSWMKVNRTNKLMEDENYRNFVVSRLNRNLDQKVSEDAFHIEDVCISRNVFKGMLALLKSIIHGLGHTINNHGLGGMASAYMVLEIAHTHYWAKDPSNKSDPSMTPEKMSLHGSHESLDSPGRKLSDDISTSKWWQTKRGSLPQAHITSAPHSLPKPHPAATTAATHTINNTPVATSTLNPSEAFTSSSPVIVNGDEFENIEITSVSDDGGGSSNEQYENTPHQHSNITLSKAKDRNNIHHVPDSGGGGDSSGFMTSADWNKNAASKMSVLSHQQIQRHQQQTAPPPVSCDIVVTDVDPESRAHQSQGDMLREMVKNKELIKTGKLDRKFNSLDSEMSEASTLVSTSSEKEDFEKKRHRINHQSIRSALSDSEMETNWPGSLHARHSRSSSVWSNKSAYSSGYRFHEGKLVHVGTAGLTAENAHSRTYLFEELVGKDRSRVWDHMQFWEDMFLDAVAQERDIIGMDQRPSEMMERYNSLGDAEKKRLEYDEDRLLAVMLFNQAAFMLMMRVPKNEIKKKIRRLLGKSHIGLVQSQDINNLLDNIQHLYGNDIDLKPMCSRRMQKQSFTVHWGNDNTGDMLFMEVCDDCLLLRSVTGAIHDRWWFEKLVNMTYCPKTKVLCLWRKNQDKVQLNQFYTKKCKELYFSVKEAMEKAASRNTGRLPGPELGGEFPVQDLKTKEGGLLQVCMEGIGLLLQNSKLFIELARIRKCFTQKGGIFVLEEFDPKTKQIILHRFKSSMANDIVFMFHRMISIRLANIADSNKRYVFTGPKLLYVKTLRNLSLFGCNDILIEVKISAAVSANIQQDLSTNDLKKKNNSHMNECNLYVYFVNICMSF
ncbi:MAP kinase-activating death domain protein [Bulinus truncatus]|nr:MAP kinase-activating death domain protein [Bulinus truncatus]